MIKKTAFFIALLISSTIFSQQLNLDKYQYIIVQDKFDFLRETDQYQTSSLTKFLLEKKGFKVFLSNDTMPLELTENKCLSLLATVKDESSMFSIKNSIEIKDCFGKTLFTSEIGKSKDKDYKKGYQEAIRNAFQTMKNFKYSYNPSLVDVKIEEKKEAVITEDDSKNVIIPIKTTPLVTVTPQVNIDTKKETTVITNSIEVLYSQPKNNGFQLVNTKPEVVFIILKTNVKDVFIINDKNGILYKVGENWVAEYYENNQVVTKEYQIKF